MTIRQFFLLFFLTSPLLSPSVHADPWGSIVHFAGSVAGDVVKGYFKPTLKLSEADVIKKRMDMLEYRYKQFNTSKGKPQDYKEVGELIISLKNMTIALTTRVGNIESELQHLEQRIAVLEAKHRQEVQHINTAPTSSYYTPPTVIKNTVATTNKFINIENNTHTIDCSTTTIVEELMNCYSPIIIDKK